MAQNLLSSSVVAGVLAFAASAVWSAPAQACGGFFCSQAQPVNQAAERIIFSQNGDGTVTAVIQILYEGPSENFSWLLPISSVPDGDDIAVASDLAFARLQQATNPAYNLTTRVEGTCAPSRFANATAGSAPAPQAAAPRDSQNAGSGVTVAASGVVGAFEWTALALDPALARPADAAITWLTSNGYDVTPGSDALLGPYLEDGNYLLALRLTKGSDTGSIRPIVLTYDADLPMIPIKLTAVAANENMGVMTWLLSDTRAVPMNYAALELNEARINWFNASSNYNDVVTAAADDAGGQGFVTEFAAASRTLADVVWPSSEEQNWQSLRAGTYRGFGELFDTLYSYYQGYDGFWDAIRASVTLPPAVSFADFQSCPNCYSADLRFSPSAVFAALEASVIKPIRDVQELLDRRPYVTRLYSTLSAGDMTVDPLFTSNPNLANVSNVHTAERIIECNPNIDLSQANWRIELPQGDVVRGSPEDVGNWPRAFNNQPPNRRVLQLSSSGAGTVLEDNQEAIGTQLAQYNDSVMSGVPMVDRMPTDMPSSGKPGSGMPGSAPPASGPLAGAPPSNEAMVVRDKGCSLGGAPVPPSSLIAWAATALLACSRLRRRGAHTTGLQKAS
ncbi:MAG: DUF2330 domain-containing protein [Deltaproteobacteria bacterium]